MSGGASSTRRDVAIARLDLVRARRTVKLVHGPKRYFIAGRIREDMVEDELVGRASRGRVGRARVLMLGRVKCRHGVRSVGVEPAK